MARNNHKKNSDDPDRLTIRDPNAAQRVNTALDLFAQGLTYEEIAKRAGYNSKQACHTAIQRELQRRVYHSVDEAREQLRYQADRAIEVLMIRLTESQGKGPYALEAAAKLVQLLDYKTKLLGAYPKAEVVQNEIIIRQYDVDLSNI